MITYHATSSNPIDGGYFMVNGKRGNSCDSVLDLFEGGMKADEEAHRILSKWSKEGEEKAAANEKAWNKFNAENPWAVNGIQ